MPCVATQAKRLTKVQAMEDFISTQLESRLERLFESPENRLLEGAHSRKLPEGVRLLGVVRIAVGETICLSGRKTKAACTASATLRCRIINSRKQVSNLFTLCHIGCV